MDTHFRREHSSPLGAIWFLRDAIPNACMEQFDLGQVSSVATSDIRGRLFELGGQAAWTTAVSECRKALDELLAVGIRQFIDVSESSEGTASNGGAKNNMPLGPIATHSMMGYLDIYFQGMRISEWQFCVNPRLEILRYENDSYLLAISVTLYHERVPVLYSPRVECWWRDR
jgi:hypothetical protein